MNPASRGIRNAFRNPVRTSSIVLILGLSMGLSLTMLVAHKAVEKKIESVKGSIGNTINVSPAGFNPGSNANNALTTAQLDTVKALPHVSSAAETLTDRLSTTGSSVPTFGRSGDSTSSGSTTSLTSPVTLSKNRFMNGGADSGDATVPFSLPVSFLGTTTPTMVNGATITLKSGSMIDGSSDTNNALLSNTMASKNNLSVGSTFTAYNTTLTVAGIFTTTTQGAEDTVVLSLPVLQRLSSQTGDVTSATITVDSLDNLSSVTAAIKNKLGSNADVTSAQEQANTAVQPLNSVKTVSTVSLIGAMTAGAVIILLTMIMVVRERTKEIGVLKAIGGSNLRIVSEFMVESLTLAVLGAVVGLLIGVVGGQPVTKMLVNNSSGSSTSQAFQRSGRFGGTLSGAAPDNTSTATTRPAFGGGFGGGFRRNGAVRGIGNIKAPIGPAILLEGFGAAMLIAVIGSALAAGMISRVRPSTIMRAE